MKSVIRPLLFLAFAFLMVFLMQARIEEMERQKAQSNTMDESHIIYSDEEKSENRTSLSEEDKKTEEVGEKAEAKREQGGEK